MAFYRMDPATEEEIEALKSIYGVDLEAKTLESGSALVRVALKGHDVGASWFSASIEFLLSPKYPSQPPAKINLRHPRGLNESEIDGCLAAAWRVFEQPVDEEEFRHLLYDAIEAARDYLSKRSGLSLPCPICLHGFTADDSVFVTAECSHHFHTFCLARYVDHAKREQRSEGAMFGRFMAQEKALVVYCPVCRSVIDANGIGSGADDGDVDQQPKAWASPDSPTSDSFTDLLSLSNPIERNFKELWERQKRNGGIIDLQKEKDRFLVTEHTRVPSTAARNSSTSYPQPH